MWVGEEDSGFIFKCVLFYVNFVEFIGFDEDIVIGEVDVVVGF